MRNLCIFTALVWAFTALTLAQDNRVFDWTPANNETIPMEPASLHAGRTYHPAAGGGNMHVQIEAHYPVTVAMTWADEWNNAMQHSDAPLNFSFICIEEHVPIYQGKIDKTLFQAHLRPLGTPAAKH